MTTITWRRGSADPLVFQPVQADGTPAPLDGPATSRALPYSFPNTVDQDFGLEISGPPSLITTGMAITTSLTGDFEFSEIRIVPVGGNIRLRFVSQHAADGSPANAIEVDTPVAVPTANFTMTIFVKDCWCRVKVGAATAIDRIVYAGTQIWAKPVTAPASIFSLTTAQAGKSGFNVTDATDTGIKLNRATTTRG